MSTLNTSNISKFLKVIVAVAAIAIVSNTNALTITFAPLAGSNGDDYLGHTEGGFTVTPTVGAWEVAQLFGNPTPDIFSSSDTAAIKVTDGGAFTFSSVDLGDANQGNPAGPNYLITGLLGGSSIFSFSGQNLPYGFTTVANPFSGSAIDELDITMTRVATSSYNIDNIVVNSSTSVPDAGGTGCLLSLALVFLGSIEGSKAKEYFTRPDPGTSGRRA